MNASDYCTITTTTDNTENADLITQTLLQEELAACIQRSNIESAYRWKGKIITSREYRLDIKTTVILYEKVTEVIGRLHIYEVPELHMSVWDEAHPDYLGWIAQETLHPDYVESVDESLLKEL
jgi:periplasmic divalent cation tolerance protein